MSRARRLLLLAALLPVVASATAPAAGARAGAGPQGDPRDPAVQERAGTQDLRERADGYGRRVEAAREGGDGEDALLALREDGERLHAACRAHVRALEADTQEDEARLEALYRSDRWHDIHYALAAIRYWQAWIDLAIAGAARDRERRIVALSAAERGFQATAVRILFPGLVYGSWLGMAEVEIARGDDAAAERRLERLAQALAGDAGNPLAAIVDAELAVLRARRGAAPGALPPADANIDPATARRLEEEAFAQLERRRKDEVIATDAGERLARLVAAGYLDDRLLARMLSWRNELAGRALGTTGLLVDAEYAFASAQYETTVLKYREFERAGGFEGRFDVAPFRYRFAVALYELHYFREAGARAAALVDHAGVGAAARKLRFLAAREGVRERPGGERERELAAAARDFLARDGGDPDAGLARLALAALPGEDGAAHLAAARRDPRLRAAADRAALERALAQFAGATRSGDLAGRAQSARDALALLEQLPRKERETPALRALALQMRVATGEGGEEVLAALAELRAAAPGDAELAAQLAWTELRALQGDALLAAVERMAGPGDDAATRELLGFLRERERQGDTAGLEPLLARAIPALDRQPDTQRQLMLARTRALLGLGRPAEALALSGELVRRFPDSGDAWRSYAETAEAAGDAFGAGRGWAMIAANTPVGSDPWLQATLSAVRLRGGGEAAANCAALLRAAAFRARMDGTMRGRFDTLSRENDCTIATGAADA